MWSSIALLGLLIFTCGCRKEDDSELRRQALKDYQENYIGSHISDPGWTGHVSNCSHGTITEFSRAKVIQRLNYFRRMVGLSDDLIENLSQHDACQQASLMFKAQDDLSHHPTPDWACYTPEGAAAAATSNIAWGTHMAGEWSVHTTYGITGFIEEPGDNNTQVGHRAWFFYPGLHSVGIGSTNTTSCIQWKDNYISGAPAPEFIAYPPDGYIPNALVFPRWSFCLPDNNADYQNVSVTMRDEKGNQIMLTVENKPKSTPGRIPFPHLVWKPELDLSKLRKDRKFNVTISNITGVPVSKYSYTVIVFPVITLGKRITPDYTDDRLFMSWWRTAGQ